MNKQQLIEQYVDPSQLIASGAFSTVYSDPSSNLVTKVCFDDPAYFAWLDRVIYEQFNAWVPKISSVTEVWNDEPGEWYQAEWNLAKIITMEKLTPIVENQLLGAIRGYLILDYEQASIVDKILVDNFSMMERQQLYVVRSTIEELTELEKFQHDIFHEDNIMMRGDQYVVVDPITIPLKEHYHGQRTSKTIP